MYYAVAKSQLTLLVLFDISAAFDKVDHQILPQWHQTSCGLLRFPLLRSHLSHRTQIISWLSRTPWVAVIFGGPQGSVSDTLLFILCTADIPSLFPNHLAIATFLLMMSKFVSLGSSVQFLLTSQIDALSQDLHVQ